MHEAYRPHVDKHLVAEFLATTIGKHEASFATKSPSNFLNPALKLAVSKAVEGVPTETIEESHDVAIELRAQIN